MNWRLIPHDLRGSSSVVIRDRAGFIGHVFLYRITPGEIRDALEAGKEVEVEIVIKEREGKNNNPATKS